MKKFSYKFESILQIKESLVKKAQKEVALAEKRIFETKQKKEGVSREMDEIRFSLKSGSVRAIDLQFRESRILHLKKEIEKIDLEIKRLEMIKKQRLEELSQKSKESKIFEKLKEVHKENYLEEEKRLEMITLDEVAIQKQKRELH